MQLITVKIEKPDDTNFVLGQTHFIKSVEDIHEALVGAVPGIKFGLAFCEASGKCLVRWSGTDPTMIELAKKNATSIGAGHSFILFLGDGFYPLNVLNTLKMVSEVCRIFCATANPRRLSWPKPSRAEASWAWWTDSPRRALRTRGTSSGGRTSCARSATSCKRKRWVGHDRR
jgi:adenosine/AMP kinase